MKKSSVLTLLTVMLLSGCISTQHDGGTVACDCNRAVRVPDKVFRTWLVDKGYATKAGWHTLKPTTEGCALTMLECYDLGIHSLEGIEVFSQLKHIACSDNPITKLDLNRLPNLKSLYGLNMPLKRIHIGQCHHLRTIELSHTELDTFSLAPFPELVEFFCIHSPLRSLDLTPCPALESLYIRGTLIREVDITPCHNFRAFYALDTPLERLIVTPEQYQSDIKTLASDSVQVVVMPSAR